MRMTLEFLKTNYTYKNPNIKVHLIMKKDWVSRVMYSSKFFEVSYTKNI